MDEKTLHVELLYIKEKLDHIAERFDEDHDRLIRLEQALDNHLREHHKTFTRYIAFAGMMASLFSAIVTAILSRVL